MPKKPVIISLIRYLFLLPVLFSLPVFSQVFLVEGQVRDEATREPLAFVNIVINEGRTGISSDIDGKFSIRSSNPINTLTLSYIGYETKIFAVPQSGEEEVIITMKKREVELAEVVIYPTENPAHRIINLVIENKDRHVKIVICTVDC